MVSHGRADMTRDRAVLCAEASRAASEAITLDDLARTVMPLLEGAFATSASCLYRFTAGGIEQIRGTLGELDEYTANLYAEDPLQAAMRRHNHWISHCTRFPEWSAYTRLPVYDFSLRQGIDDFMILRLSQTEHDVPGMVGIMLARSRLQARFGERDEWTAARLLPGLKAVVRRSARLAELDGQRWLFEALLEREGHPKLALDGQGRLLWASRRAEEMLGLRGGGEAGLPPPLVTAARRLGTKPGPSPDSVFPDPVVEVPRPDAAPIAAELRLVRASSGEAFILAELMVPEAPPRLAEVAARARLTPAETEVLALLALGLKNREIAARRFVSVDTVHTHVGRILSKLGVRTRAQALLVVRGVKPPPG
jgi:DNA-binding CsgD family transcriptional regulator/PAS domain-containing protein